MFLICGEAVIDFFGRADSPLGFDGQAAGSPFNVAVGLARLGRRAALVTGLSRDAFGDRLIAAMTAEGVDWRLAPRTDRPTILSFVTSGHDGAPAYAFYGERGADVAVTAADVAHLPPREAQAVHLGGFPLAVEPAKTAYAGLIRRAAGRCFVSLDPNVRPQLMGELAAFAAQVLDLARHVALIKASVEDIGHLQPGEEPLAVARRWLAEGAAAVVVTDGAKGATFVNAKGAIHAPATPVAVVDAVGAGDAFMSALLAGLQDAGLLDRPRLAAVDPQRMGPLLARANRAAALACARRGADPPTSAELDAA